MRGEIDLSFSFIHSLLLTYAPPLPITKALRIGMQCRRARDRRCTVRMRAGKGGIWRPGHGGNRRRRKQLPSIHPWPPRSDHCSSSERDANAATTLLLSSSAFPFLCSSTSTTPTPTTKYCTVCITCPSSGPARAALVVATSRREGRFSSQSQVPEGSR